MRYLFILNIIICITYILCDEDLYDVLGITRSANSADIKKAYKKLARKWHPDKNRDASAQDIFVKINEAYETLGDEKKRANYDNFGHRSGVENQNQDFGFNFNFGGRSSNLNKQRLSLNHFENSILPNSGTRPFIIFAHSTFCFPCMRIEPVWENFVRDLEEIGLGAGTLQAQLDHALARKLRVSTIPAIIAVVDGQYVWCNTDGRVNLQHLRDFIRDKVFPSNLITKLETPEEIDDFLSSYRRDNRVRAIHYASRPRPSQRYLAAAFAHRRRVACAYISLKHGSIEKLLKKYKVSFGRESLLIFNEDYQTPIAHKMKAMISRSEFDEYLLQHPLLLLPRITSHDMFDQACPVVEQSHNKKICVVLFTSDESRHDKARETFRKTYTSIRDPNIRFVYVYEKFQRQFSQALNLHRPLMNYTFDSLRVALLWRSESRTLHYQWLEDGWLVNSTHQPAKHGHQETTLKILLKRMLTREPTDIGFTVALDNDLVDEHLEYLLTRIYNRVISWYDFWRAEISQLDIMMQFSLVLSIILCLFVVYFAAITISSSSKKNSNSTKKSTQPSERGSVYIHILMRSTFSQLVLNSEPGIRLIVVLVNKASKKEIINRFSNIVYKFDNGKDGNLKFAFLDLDEHIDWYRSLIEKTLSLQSEDLSKLTAQNCIGTVLCMNGARKYISIYYPRKWRSNTAKRTLMSQVLGFVESSDEEFSDKVVSVGDILKGLSSWLERLYEGNLKILKLEQWPLPTN